MMNEVVITFYGHGKTIDKIAGTVFTAPDCHEECKITSNASAYCNTMNSQRLEGDSWVFAKIVGENEPYTLNSFFPVNLDILLKLTDSSIYSIVYKTDNQDIAKALKGENDIIQNRIFSIMTEDTVTRLKKEMEHTGTFRKSEIMESKRKIIDLCRRMAGTGELYFEDEVVYYDADAPRTSLHLVKPEEDNDPDDE